MADEQPCAICLDPIENRATLNACPHCFCLDCILQWTELTNLCPLCKTRILTIQSSDKNIPIHDRVLRVNCDGGDEDLSSFWDPRDLSFCRVCGSPHSEDRLLLCDSCDEAYHLECLHPPLSEVPEGTWMCPNCEDSGNAVDSEESDSELHLSNDSGIRRASRVRNRRRERVQEQLVNLRRRRRLAQIGEDDDEATLSSKRYDFASLRPETYLEDPEKCFEMIRQAKKIERASREASSRAAVSSFSFDTFLWKKDDSRFGSRRVTRSSTSTLHDDLTGLEEIYEISPSNTNTESLTNRHSHSRNPTRNLEPISQNPETNSHQSFLSGCSKQPQRRSTPPSIASIPYPRSSDLQRTTIISSVNVPLLLQELDEPRQKTDTHTPFGNKRRYEPDQDSSTSSWRSKRSRSTPSPLSSPPTDRDANESEKEDIPVAETSKGIVRSLTDTRSIPGACTVKAELNRVMEQLNNSILPSSTLSSTPFLASSSSVTSSSPTATATPALSSAHLSFSSSSSGVRATKYFSPKQTDPSAEKSSSSTSVVPESTSSTSKYLTSQIDIINSHNTLNKQSKADEPVHSPEPLDPHNSLTAGNSSNLTAHKKPELTDQDSESGSESVSQHQKEQEEPEESVDNSINSSSSQQDLFSLLETWRCRKRPPAVSSHRVTAPLRPVSDAGISRSGVSKLGTYTSTVGKTSDLSGLGAARPSQGQTTTCRTNSALNSSSLLPKQDSTLPRKKSVRDDSTFACLFAL